MSGHVLLLTGAPGVGKTTALRRALEGLAGERVSGFLTDEIRTHGERAGFAITTLNGQRAVLAHVQSTSGRRVGRYGVDVAALEPIVDSALAPNAAVHLYVIDEIGKMECMSPKFVEAVVRLLEGGRPVIATVALRGGGFLSEVKRRPGVELWELTAANRGSMPGRILAWARARLPR